MLQEFKEFIARGNVMDLAVAVVLGAAFGKIITSFVEGILMPLIGTIGKADWNSMVAKLGTADNAPVLKYGTFITDIVNFLIVAFALFLIIKAVNRVKRPDETPAEEPNKQCPFCYSSIPAKATRCGFCTSEIGGSAATPAA